LKLAFDRVKVDALFATPVILSRLEEGQEFIDSFLSAVLEEKNYDPQGRKLSNKGGWQSNNILAENPRLGEYKSFLTSSFSLLYSSILKPDILSDMKLLNWWANVSGKGGRNAPHTHGTSLFSGVFYLKCPENGGDIVFYNDFSRDTENGAYTDELKKAFGLYPTYSYTPTVGSILLFPSTFLHSVDENKSNENRVSVSFNFGLH
jgi:uncharacterized protein (TIGR02466 family)